MTTLMTIRVESKGARAGDSAYLALGSQDLADGSYEKGLNVAIINEYTGEIIKFQTFNTAESAEQSTGFAKLVEGLTVGRIVAIAIKGKAIASMSNRAKRACQVLGSSLIFNVKEDDSWAIIGQKGAAPGSVQEQWSEDSNGITIEKTIAISAKQSSRIKAFKIEALSEGKREGGDNPTSGSMSVTKDGEVVLSGTGNNGRGLNIVVFDENDGSVLDNQHFDTWENEQIASNFASFINALPDGRLVAVAVCDEGSRYITGIGSSLPGNKNQAAIDACKSLGSQLIEELAWRNSWALIGYKGSQNALMERLSTNSSVTCYEWFLPDRSFEITVKSQGFYDSVNRNASVKVNGQEILAVSGQAYRGLNVVVFDEHDGSVLEIKRFDTFLNQQEATNFANYINDLPFGRLVAVAVCDEGSNYITDINSSPSGARNQAAIDACKSLGSTKIEQLAWRNSWALIGYKGPIWGEAVEVLSSTNASAYCQYRFTPYTAQEAINYRVSVVSGGIKAGNTAAIYVNQVPLLSEGDAQSGFNVVVIDKDSGFVVNRQSFGLSDRDRKGYSAGDFIDFIEAVPIGYIVAISLKGGVYHITDAVQYALQSIGSGLAFNLCGENSLTCEDSYAIIGIKGAAPGSAPEMLQTDGIAAVKSVFPVATIRQFNPFRVVTAMSQGVNVGNNACITANGNIVEMPNGYQRGINVVVFNQEGQVIDRGTFDTYDSTDETNKFVEFINKVNPENYVALAVKDECTWHLNYSSNEKVRQVFQSLGSTMINQVGYRDSWVLIGKKDGTKLSEAFARDGQGNATAVVNLTVPIQGSSNDALVSVESGGTNFGNSARISLKGFPGEDEQYSYQNGVNVIIFNPDEGVKRFEYFDTIQSGKAEEFAALIEQLSSGTMVAIAIQGSNALTNSERAVQACQSIGSSKIHRLSSNDSWAIVGVKGAAPGSVVEALNNKGATSCSMIFPTLEYNSSPVALGGNRRMLGLPLIAWGIYELVSVIVSAAIVGGTAAVISSRKNTSIIEYGGGFSKQGGNITDKGNKLPQNNKQPSDGQPPDKDPGDNDQKQDRNNSQKEDNPDEEKKHEVNKRILRVKALFVALDYKEEKEIIISAESEKIKNLKLQAPVQRTQELCINIPSYLDKIYSLNQQNQLEIDYQHELITDRQELLGKKAIKTEVESKLKELVNAEKSYDVLYFHFAGHGENKPSLGIVLDDGIISIQELQNLFQPISSSSKLFCTLDCCYSGGIIDSIPGFKIASTADGNSKGLELLDETLLIGNLGAWVNFTYFLKDAIFKLNPPHIGGIAGFVTSFMKEIKEKVIQHYNKNAEALDVRIKKNLEEINAKKPLLIQREWDECEELIGLETQKSLLKIEKSKIEDYRDSTQKSSVEVLYAPEDKADKVFLQNLESY